jgi:hypothetical protein
MRNRIFGAVVLLASGSVTAQISPDQVLKIEQRPDAYVLDVPVSNVVMSIPRGSLLPVTNPVGGSGQSPRYFRFADDAGLVISGWIEPASSFRGMHQFWNDETAAWKRGHAPEPRNVQFKDIGDWKVVVYDLELEDLGNTHIRAEYVGRGTWIDVHLSLTSKRSLPEAEATLKELLQSFSVSERLRR